MAAPVERLSPMDYLRRERKSEFKNEYIAGQVVAMAGASERHNLITTNLVFSFVGQLRRRPCRIYASDMRVKVGEGGPYTYPDVVIVCGTPRFDDEQRDTLLNPTVIVEVLSKSTESYDRGKKFQHYRHLESLTEYLLIAQNAPHLEHFVRQADGRWLLSEVYALTESIMLPTIDCELSLGDVYDKVEFVNAEDENSDETIEFRASANRANGNQE